MKTYYYKILVIMTVAILYACQSKTSGTTPFTYGIDISKYQGNEIDDLDKSKDSLSFIICKATEGVTYVDPDFSHNWESIAQKGFIRGAYHFYQTADSPGDQAEHFLNTIAGLQKTDLPPIVDFEEGGISASMSVEDIQSGLMEFLSTVAKNSNRKPIIYTDINTGNTYLNNAEFAAYPLWIANYNGKPQPDMPKTWQNTEWVLWQRSANYEADATTDDFDLFNGDLKALKSFIKKH